LPGKQIDWLLAESGDLPLIRGQCEHTLPQAEAHGLVCRLAQVELYIEGYLAAGGTYMPTENAPGNKRKDKN